MENKILKNIGFIGFGSIGGMFVKGFLKLKALEAKQIYVTEPDKTKTTQININYPGINICQSNSELAKDCDIVFICVKPLDTIAVFNEISDALNGETHIVSVAAGVQIETIEKAYSGKISRIIPSYTSEIHEGVTLVCHNKAVSYGEATLIEKLLNEISTVKRIKESDFAAGTALTSCSPGWISHIFDEFVNAGINCSSLSQEEAEEMVITTLYGTAKLLYDKKIGFKEVVNRVATKGGITEAGVNSFNESLPEVFAKVFDIALKKTEELEKQTNEAFGKK